MPQVFGNISANSTNGSVPNAISHALDAAKALDVVVIELLNRLAPVLSPVLCEEQAYANPAYGVPLADEVQVIEAQIRHVTASLRGALDRLGI